MRPRPRLRLRLRNQIQLLTAGMVTLLTLVNLGVLNVLARHEIEQAVHHEVKTTGGFLSQMIDERGAALRDQCRLLAAQPSLKQYLFGRGFNDARADWATVSDFARDSLRQLHADAAVITDQDGRVLGQTDAATAKPTTVLGEAGIAAALRGDEWVGVVARRGRLMLAVSVPVRGGTYVQGTFTAYRVIDAQVAEELKNIIGSDVVFVDRGGSVVGASLNGLPPRIEAPAGAPRELTLAGRGSFLALYAPLPGTDPKAGIGFVTLYSQRRALDLFYRLREAFTLVSATLLLLALAAAALFARGIILPLDKVVEAARALRSGAWPEQFEVTRADDIGLLQTAFNDMTTSMRASQERLLALIDIDPLTELDNHRRFQERLAQEIARARSSGEPLSLLLLDIDHFNAFNQREGHAAGDDALRGIAALLRETMPPVAIAARYGGEEFAVLLPRHDLDAAEAVAEGLRTATAISLSIGCAEMGDRTTGRPEGLTLATELAVSQAKQLGRDRVCRFNGDEHSDALRLPEMIKDGSLATIQALAAAVDAKDPYTQGHSRRVAEYATNLGRALGLPQSDLDLIQITGTLHDVGKIGVPDGILKKPGRLDDDERAIMETHTALGEVIVRKAPQLAATLPGVRHHHERWDGNGYPDNLAGLDIPFLGRILAVADTFDAMTSDRPYRKGLPLAVAVAEIAKNAGTQFDPELAAAFVTMMEADSERQKAA